MAAAAHQESELDVLRRRVRELEEELSEYARAEHPGVCPGADAFDTADWQLRRRHRRPTGQHAPDVGGVRLLLILMERPGHCFSYDFLLDHLARSEDVRSKIVQVYGVAARRILGLNGLDGALETVWGRGFRLTPDAAEKLAAIIAEEGA